jgi:predicted nucleotidyltransferase
MTSSDSLYPTEAHKNASLAAVDYFSKEGTVKSVLLTCSCARGKATKDSCLDLSVFTDPSADPESIKDLRNRWEKYYQREKVFEALRSAGLYSQVDLEWTDGMVAENPEEHTWTSGPDSFELAIGNLFVYSVPLYGEAHWSSLRNSWIPYYDEPLRKKRLERALLFMRNNLDHIPPYLGRGLFFQCHKRLTHAFEEFVQSLFLSRRTYPISYDKHIREQIVDILKLPELYEPLARIFEISRFESDEMLGKKKILEDLTRGYIA